MLLNSVVIVLREVLEAALMISILLATSRRLGVNPRWLLVAIVVGLVGASAYAQLVRPISEMFDGFGQELLNATLHVLVFCVLLAVLFLILRHYDQRGTLGKSLPIAMAAAVAIASLREGSEIVIYVAGFLQMGDLLGSVAIGSLAGAGIGFSVGVLFYYLLLALPAKRALWLSVALLATVAASMCLQAVKLLIQADFLSAAAPLWDSSWLVEESSLLGQLLYALVGYEATPSPVEVTVYVGSLIVIIAVAWLGRTVFVRSPGESP